MVSRAVFILLLALVGAAAQEVPANEDCSREGILKTLSAEPTIQTAVSVIKELKLTSLLPAKRGQGTLFLPKDSAFEDLGVPAEELLTTLKNQTVSILLYHSLLAQESTYNRGALVRASPIKSDLSLIQAALGDDGDYDLTFLPGPNPLLGKEEVKGTRNFSLIRGVLKICGYYVYPIDGVLIPANSLAEVPGGAGAAVNEAIALGADLNNPNGLASALKSKAIVLPAAAIAAGEAANMDTPASPPGAAEAPRGAELMEGDAASPESESEDGAGAVGAEGESDATSPGPDGEGGAGAVGAEGDADSPAGAPGAAESPEDGTSDVDGVNGAALPLNGTDGTLSSTEPVVLQGSVTSEDGAVLLGPGLVYLDGAVQDGKGVDGTATLVESLDSDGATLSERSFPLTGAVVTGLPFSAAGIMINGAEAMSPDSMGLGAMGPDGDADAMSPDGAPDGSPDSPDAMSPDGASAEGGFGTVLPGSGEGNLNFNGPTILDGTVQDGQALDGDKATGDASQGSLGPGGIYIDGEVADGKGVSGKAYPIVSLGTKNIVLNEDNGVDIEGADVKGSAYSAEGIEPKLQAASETGGAGTASAGSPGVSEPGQPSEPATSAVPVGPPAVVAVAASSTATAAASIMALLSTAAAACLVIA